jgi:capsular exopolysaccharide synthesis family protein
MVVAGGVSFSLAPKYVSEAKILVKRVSLASDPRGNVTPLNMDTEQQVAKSLAVAQLAAASLKLSLTPDQAKQRLLKNLKVTSSANTEILNLSFTARSPSLAQKGVAAFADAYLQFRRDQVVTDLTSAQASLQERIDALGSQLTKVNAQLAHNLNPDSAATLRAQANQLIDQIGFLQGSMGSLLTPEQLAVGAIVEPAIPPIHPASSHVRNIILAFVVGLALGVGVAFLRDHLDDRLRNRGEVEGAIQAPVLGVLPFGPVRAAIGSSIAVSREQGMVPDAFRALRTGFLFAATRADAKTFIVTSPLAEEGKTTTVASLGVSLTQAGKTVILISADLRRPRLHKLFGCENNFGLTNILAGEREPFDGLIILPDVVLLPSGPSPANVIDLLDSEAMKKLLATFRANVDFVLIDTGPVLSAPDAMALAPLVDAVLVVVNAQQTTRSAAQRARKQLELVNARVIGTVLYDPADKAEEDYYDYYYSFSSAEPSGNGKSHGNSASAPRVEPEQRPPATNARPQPERHETPRQAPRGLETPLASTPAAPLEIDLRQTQPATTAEVQKRTAVEHPREGV